MSYTFDKTNKWIIVDAPETEVVIQDLYNNIRDYEDEYHVMDMHHLADASGKEELGGGVYVGITLKLLDGWKLKNVFKAGGKFC